MSAARHAARVAIVPPQHSTISAALDGRRNSFGALRLLFAAAVIISHAFPIAGVGDDPTWALWDNQAHIGLLAVYGFLGISGYVITKSAARLHPVRFAWHRVLRLYPAFWAALVVSAFVISPAVWAASGRNLSAFWAEPHGPVGYVLRNATLWIDQWDIHDLFAPAPLGVSPSIPTLAGTVNGSLWSLSFELMCYILIGLLAWFGVLRGAPFLVPVTAAFFGLMQIANILIPGASSAVAPVLGEKMVTLGWVFFIGATAATYSHRIPMRHAFGVVAILITIATLWRGGFLLLGIPAFIYATIWIASALPSLAHKVGAKNDYSYGIYLYGWPVQQTLAASGLHQNMFLFITLSMLGAAMLAWLSWHGIEKRAMRLKDLQLPHRKSTPAPADAVTV